MVLVMLGLVDSRKNHMPTRGDSPIISPKLDPRSFGIAMSEEIMAPLLSIKWLAFANEDLNALQIEA